MVKWKTETPADEVVRRKGHHSPKTSFTSSSLAELAPENERKNSLVTLERGEREETNGTGKKISTTRVEVE